MADVRKKTPYKGLTLKLTGHPVPVTVPPPPPTGPIEDEITDVDALMPADVPERTEPARDDETGIEVIVVREDATPRRARQAWRAIEVWTKNRVYGMDSSFICIEVVDRQSGRLDSAHPILGGKLGGGRRRSGKGAIYTHPLPIPGTEAMFMRARKQGYTSTVERVIIRIRALRVRNSATWEQVVEENQKDDDKV